MKSVTKTDAAFEELRQAIYSGEFKSGQSLPITQLQDRLGLSPTPIREALRLLQAAGLVTHQPHHGMIVRTTSVAQDERIFEIRLELEPLAAARAAENATPQQLSEIRSHREKMVELAKGPIGNRARLESLRTTQLAMMQSIHAAANSAPLLDFIERLWSSLPSGRPWCQWEDLVADQNTLVDAILDGNSARARREMKRYLTNARRIELEVADRMTPVDP